MIVLADWLAYTCALFLLAAFALSLRLPANTSVWESQFAASVVLLQISAVGCAAVAWFILLFSFALN